MKVDLNVSQNTTKKKEKTVYHQYFIAGVCDGERCFSTFFWFVKVIQHSDEPVT